MKKDSDPLNIIHSDICIKKIIDMTENNNLSSDWRFVMNVPQQYNSLMYIIDGAAAFYMNEIKYNISKGMVVMRKKGETFRSNGIEKHFHYIEISFDILEENIDDAYPCKYIYEVAQKSVFENLFSKFRNVWNSHAFGFEIRAKSILNNILYQLILEYLSDKKISKAYNSIKNSIKYLNENCFNSALNIEDLSKESNITSSRFRQIFKEIYGESPLSYINYLRIEKAKNFLLTTSKSITQVALEVGFSDVYYFSRAFKKHVGVNPSYYRDTALIKKLDLKKI